MARIELAQSSQEVPGRAWWSRSAWEGFQGPVGYSRRGKTILVVEMAGADSTGVIPTFSLEF